MSVAARRSAAGKIGEAPSWAAIARMGYRPGDGPARRPVGPATRGDTIGLACATRRRERGHSARAARGDPARRPRRAPGEAGRSAALRQRERLVPVGARPRESGTRKGHPPPSRLTSSAARRRQAGPAARERLPVARASPSGAPNRRSRPELLAVGRNPAGTGGWRRWPVPHGWSSSQAKGQPGGTPRVPRDRTPTAPAGCPRRAWRAARASPTAAASTHVDSAASGPGKTTTSTSPPRPDPQKNGRFGRAKPSVARPSTARSGADAMAASAGWLGSGGRASAAGRDGRFPGQ